MRFPLTRGLEPVPQNCGRDFRRILKKIIFKNNNPPYPLKKGESPDLDS
jgi:hypothetical protein